MAGLSKKDTRTVLRSLEEQGAVLKPTTNGHRILFPDGSTTSVHWSHTDRRGIDNLRAAIRRAGFSWPFDGKDKKAMNAAERKRKHAEVRELIELYLADTNDGEPVNPGHISTELDMNTSVIYKHLTDLGYVKVGYADWRKQPKVIDTELTAVLSAPETESEINVDIPVSIIEPEEGTAWRTVKMTKGIAELRVIDLMNAYRAAGFTTEIRIIEREEED